MSEINPIILREEKTDRFLVGTALISLGFLFTFGLWIANENFMIGIPILISGITVLAKGIWFSPSTTFADDGIHHIEFNWFTKNETIYSYDAVTKFIEENRASTEQGRCVKLEIDSNHEILLPSEATSRCLMVYKTLKSKGKRIMPSTRITT